MTFQAIARSKDVLYVANDLQVKLGGSRVRANTKIAQAARQVLERKEQFPGERIRATVSEGWVTLEGGANSLCKSQDVENAVRELAGVRGVKNKLAINPCGARNASYGA
jgi:osmotically-inducible protein OsmY